MRALTARQIETLRAIYDFITANGIAPTIGELRRALSLASDQGVLDILKRLEERGVIEKRSAGQARSLKLTAEGHLAIGVPNRLHAHMRAFGSGFELNPVQLLIHSRLCDIDPKLSRMYEGGLRVLLDANNPERIVLSAHSIRESTYHLSNLGKGLLHRGEAKAAKDLKISNARQLERLFDPLGGTRHFNSTMYDRWSKDFHNFFVEVSHHRLEIGFEDYCAKLAEYEQFLCSYVLPLQTEIYARLDEQLRDGPNDADSEDLHFLLSRNIESYRYFFRKADVRWLDFLTRNGLLFATWEAADFLARIAPDASDDVMEAIERMPTRPDDWATRKGLIEAAVRMPTAVSRRLISKMRMEKWFSDARADWLSHILTDLLARFIEGAQHKDALDVACLIFESKGPSESQMREYHHEEILKRFSQVQPNDLPRYIRFLVKTLERAINHDRPNARDDGSLVWRPAIEDHDQNKHHGQQKSSLVTAIREALKRYIAHVQINKDCDLAATLEDLLYSESRYSVFSRLRLNIYNAFPGHFMPAVEKSILTDLQSTNCWHEYFHLLKEQLPAVSESTRDQWFKLLDRGPDGEHDDDYKQHWKARKLSAVIDVLTPEERTKYQFILPIAQVIEHPDFLVYMEVGWIGPTSPLSKENVKAMSVDEIVNYLASWKPSDRWNSQSREGLGHELSAAVQERAADFSTEAHRFLNNKIPPVYVYYLLCGFQNPIKTNIQIDWRGITKLALEVLRRAESKTLPVLTANSDIDSWEVEWSATFQEIARLLETGLQNTAVGLPFNERTNIWRLLKFLCEHPDPTPEHEQEYGGDNMDPFTLSINSVRGQAFHALFAYIFWCDRHLAGKGEFGSRIPPECKALLEAHLNTHHDPSLTIRSVYGFFFPWLFVYDPDWTTQLCERLFPAKDAQLRYAAWETYLANAVFPKVYAVLKERYELAISELRKCKETRRYWSNPVQRLADHMMIAYAFRMEEDKSASWSRFFRVATPNQRGRAVSFAGRAYVLRDSETFNQLPPDKNRLQEFWEWRLAESNDREELQEFGWWIKAGRFNDKWMLERLLETLTKTDGAIQADVHVLEGLSALAIHQPELCGEALMLIVKSRFTERWILGPQSKVQNIVTTIYGDRNDKSRAIAIGLIDYLTKLGFETYRNITYKSRPELPGTSS